MIVITFCFVNQVGCCATTSIRASRLQLLNSWRPTRYAKIGLVWNWSGHDPLGLYGLFVRFNLVWLVAIWLMNVTLRICFMLPAFQLCPFCAISFWCAVLLVSSSLMFENDLFNVNFEDKWWRIETGQYPQVALILTRANIVMLSIHVHIVFSCI